MATSILLACGLNDAQLPPLLFIEENTGTDASFLINCILSHRLKVLNTQKSKIILCCCHQTFNHYHNAGLRLGYNLNSYKEKNRIATIEPLQDLYDNGLASKYLNSTPDAIKSYFEEMIRREFNENDDKIILIIDDLTFLADFGVTEMSMVRILKFLEELKVSHPGLSVILKTNTSEAFEVLTNFVKDAADLVIVADRLKSGNFREVDGKLSIYKMNAETEILQAVAVAKTVLYKVTDRAVKIFAPGEVGIKI